MSGRVVSTASLIIDLPIQVSQLPERGGDVLGEGAPATPGGGFNIVAAAARQRVAVGLLSPIGTGRNGDLGRQQLGAEGVAHLGRTATVLDTGYCVTLTEPDGERSFVTVPGAEAEVSPSDLPSDAVAWGDTVFLSGYDLCYAGSGPALVAWMAGLNSGIQVVFDPGPLVGDIPPQLLAVVLARCDVLTLNEREAEILWDIRLSEAADPVAVARVAREQIHAGLSASASVLIRIGSRGCLIVGECVTLVPSIEVPMVDATGAGDAHAGALMARLLLGDDLPRAVYLANIAAALTVSQRGPATSPTRGQVEAAAQQHRWSLPD
ncbi:MAG: PfkB family carbohydrate kinase [Propioniciclava sp.]